GVQVHGGMGFIEETGAAQHYRDSRIAAIYEGTNGIQAIDLVGRKLPMRDGDVVRELLAEVEETAGKLRQAGEPELADALGAAVDDARRATEWLLAASPEDRLAGASPYLRLLGVVTGGWFQARTFLAQGAGARRRAEARFYLLELLPQAGWLGRAATAGNAI